MYIIVAALVVAALLGLVHAAAMWWLRRLRALPDKYSFERLSRDPQGEEVFVDRPDGTCIRVIHAGKGQPVVFSHGYGGHVGEWNVLFDDLVAAGFRCIAFDHRAFGRSTVGSDGVGSRQMAGDIQAVLEHFDVRDGLLVGHSMGGFVSLVFSIVHADVARDRLRGLVLIGTGAGDVYKGSPQNRVLIPLIRLGLFTRLLRSPTYGSLTVRGSMGDEPFPAALEAGRRMLMSHDYRAVLPITEALGHESWYGRLGEIPVPAVVVCGTKDRAALPWHSQRLGAEIPGSRNVWVPGKGHFVTWEAPEVLIEAIRSFRP